MHANNDTDKIPPLWSNLKIPMMISKKTEKYYNLFSINFVKTSHVQNQIIFFRQFNYNLTIFITK